MISDPSAPNASSREDRWTKIERQRHQINILNNRVIERNSTIAAQDLVIADQGDEILRLQEENTRLKAQMEANR